MKRIAAIVAGLAVLALAGGVLAAADGVRAADDECADCMKKCARMKAAKRMGLTEDQQKKLSALGEKYGPEAKKLAAERRDLVKELARQVRSEAKEADLQKTLDSLAKNRAASEALRDRREKDSRAILTPVQQARFVLRMAREARDGKAGMRGPRMHQGPRRPGMRGPGAGDGGWGGERRGAMAPRDGEGEDGGEL
jgi:Spy/CpxP family protein refolding chaperone